MRHSHKRIQSSLVILAGMRGSYWDHYFVGYTDLGFWWGDSIFMGRHSAS
uniref:Uncharacterized protein n=1 Tax=Anguilla anguilla TaxID=7936 RepID=A0A0E9PBK8_ANGAN